VLMRYSLHEIDKHQVVAATVAADRDEALALRVLGILLTSRAALSWHAHSTVGYETSDERDSTRRRSFPSPSRTRCGPWEGSLWAEVQRELEGPEE